MFKIYIIGLLISISWFFFAAVLTFEKKLYDSSSEEGKEAIDHMHKTLEDISPKNPQLVFFLISILVSLTWPVSVPYIMIRNRMK